MALAYVDNLEAWIHPKKPEGVTKLAALEGSSEQRSYLLDDTIHVVGLWKFIGLDREHVTVVDTFSSYDLNGQPLDPWSILDSRQHQSRSSNGMYIQTYVRPEAGVGRIDMSWLRIPEEAQEMALFANPNSLPRNMEPIDLPRQVGHLAIVK